MEVLWLVLLERLKYSFVALCDSTLLTTAARWQGYRRFPHSRFLKKQADRGLSSRMLSTSVPICHRIIERLVIPKRIRTITVLARKRHHRPLHHSHLQISTTINLHRYFPSLSGRLVRVEKYQRHRCASKRRRIYTQAALNRPRIHCAVFCTAKPAWYKSLTAWPVVGNTRIVTKI